MRTKLLRIAAPEMKSYYLVRHRLRPLIQRDHMDLEISHVLSQMCYLNRDRLRPLIQRDHMDLDLSFVVLDVLPRGSVLPLLRCTSHLGSRLPG